MLVGVVFLFIFQCHVCVYLNIYYHIPHLMITLHHPFSWRLLLMCKIFWPSWNKQKTIPEYSRHTSLLFLSKIQVRFICFWGSLSCLVVKVLLYTYWHSSIWAVNPLSHTHINKWTTNNPFARLAITHFQGGFLSQQAQTGWSSYNLDLNALLPPAPRMQ